MPKQVLTGKTLPNVYVSFALIHIYILKILNIQITFIQIFDKLVLIYLSIPSCIRKVTRPKAAGALCNIIAKNTIISTSAWLVEAAAPSATPSAEIP